MKKFLLLSIPAVALLFSFHVANKNAEATAKQYSGVYVFTDCTPNAEYTVLGTVEIKTASSSQYEPVRDKLLKKALKEYPKCEGVIMNLNYGRADKADCITFK